MTLPYGSRLCDGIQSAVNPGRPCTVCVACLRRTSTPVHVWQKYLQPPPAKHDGTAWRCEQQILGSPA